MNDKPLRVDNLRKISIAIQAGTAADRMDLTGGPVDLSFIFGIGNEGITPFEYELVDKQPGDCITVRVNRRNAPVFFEHLAFPVLQAIDGADAFFLSVHIVDVTTPGAREIVRAIAEKSSCGEDCDCGCGCDI